jgi:hypothetical protein
MINSLVDLDSFLSFTSFLKNQIIDNLKNIKKVTPEVKQLYISDKYREAEKVLKMALHRIFQDAIEAAVKNGEEMIKNEK